MSSPSDLNLANDIRPSKQQQKRQYCSLVGRKEKRIKKLKQSITNGNPTMLCHHAPLHVEEGMVAHPVIRHMDRFDHREVSLAPP
jgi:hypothetical protein